MAVVTVTSENLEQFNAERMNGATPTAEAPAPAPAAAPARGPDGKFIAAPGSPDPGAEERVRAAEAARLKAESDAALANRRVQELVAKYEKPPEPTPKPDPESGKFKDWKEYAEALEKWTREDESRQAAQRAAERALQERNAQIMNAWNSARDQLIASGIPDWHDVINNATGAEVYNVVMAEVLASDKGPQLAYIIAGNPELRSKWRAMSPAAAMKELGKLEDHIDEHIAKMRKGAPAPAPAPAAPAKGTAPISDLGTGGTPPAPAPAPAPAPEVIEPIRGGAVTTDIPAALVATNPVHYVSQNNAKAWRDLRKAGRIK